MSENSALSSVNSEDLSREIWETREERTRLFDRSQELRGEIVILHERIKDLKKRISKLENSRIVNDVELRAVMDHLDVLIEKKRGN